MKNKVLQLCRVTFRFFKPPVPNSVNLHSPFKSEHQRVVSVFQAAGKEQMHMCTHVHPSIETKCSMLKKI